MEVLDVAASGRKQMEALCGQIVAQYLYFNT